MQTSNYSLILLLRISVFGTFFGRGMLQFTAPQQYDILFTNPGSLLFQEGLLQQDVFFEATIIRLTMGVLLILFALLICAPARFFATRLRYLILIPMFLVFVQCYVSYINAHFAPEQLIEHSLQIGLPLIFVFSKGFDTLFNTSNQLYLQILTALTFIGHGLFAIGWNYVPDNFMDMVQQSFHLENQGALRFLYVAGILDFITSVLIFTNFLRVPSLYYMIAWGALTSLARWYAYTGIMDTSGLLAQQSFQVLLRIPHFTIPLLICYCSIQRKQFAAISSAKQNDDKQKMSFNSLHNQQS